MVNYDDLSRDDHMDGELENNCQSEKDLAPYFSTQGEEEEIGLNVEYLSFTLDEGAIFNGKPWSQLRTRAMRDQFKTSQFWVSSFLNLSFCFRENVLKKSKRSFISI